MTKWGLLWECKVGSIFESQFVQESTMGVYIRTPRDHIGSHRKTSDQIQQPFKLKRGSYRNLELGVLDGERRFRPTKKPGQDVHFHHC